MATKHSLPKHSRPKVAKPSNTKSVAITTLGNLSVLASSLVTAPLLAQALNAGGRGELAAATAPLLLATAGLTIGMPEAVTYFVAKRIAAKRVLLIGILGVTTIGLAGSLSIMLLAPILSSGSQYLEHVIQVVALALTPSLIGLVFRGYARGKQMWNLIAFDQALSGIFRVVAIVALISTDSLTVLSAGITLGIANFVGTSVYILIPRLSRSKARLLPPSADVTAVPKDLVRRVLGYGSGVWLGAAAGVMLARLDQVLILPLSDAEQLGLYAVAASLADIVRVFNSAVRDVVFATQASVLDDRALARACRVSNGITACAALGLAAIAWLLVPVLFGRDFSGSLVPLSILLVGTVLGNPGSVVAAGLSARGKPLLRSIAISLGLLIDIVGIFVLVPMCGAVGAAVATSIANIATGGIVLFFAHHYFKLEPAQFLTIRRGDIDFIIARLSMLIGKRSKK